MGLSEPACYRENMPLTGSFFAQKFGISPPDLQTYLNEALSRGGDYADLYFEYVATSSVSLEESLVKSASQGVTLGVGVRVLSGERTCYVYAGDLSPGGNPPGVDIMTLRPRRAVQ